MDTVVRWRFFDADIQKCACGFGWANNEVCLRVYDEVRYYVFHETNKVMAMIMDTL